MPFFFFFVLNTVTALFYDIVKVYLLLIVVKSFTIGDEETESSKNYFTISLASYSTQGHSHHFTVPDDIPKNNNPVVLSIYAERTVSSLNYTSTRQLASSLVPYSTP